MTPTVLLVVFIALAAAHVVSEGFKYMPGRYFVKPLLMPALALYYLFSTEAPNGFMLAAIGFGWLGDIFLMVPDPDKTRRYFRPGLVAFLLGHVFYIIVFASYISGMERFPAAAWLLLVPYIATGVFGYRLIGPHAGAMKKAILAYTVIFVAMGAATVLPMGSALLGGVLTAMAGSFVFMVSDIINAYNKFAREIANERVYTMSTYLAGQLLLVQGYLMF
ncbi:MAG TPA: lysoplasmalogenase [Spirochaetota bacterium]|nr:lysoplasmalogenase [Spirochaetota bacterium]